MNYVLCVLPWDLPPVAALDLPAFLTEVKALGFDTISLVANLHRQDTLDTDVLPHAQAVRAAGMGLLLRIVASTEHADFIPRACRLQDGGLNIYHPRAKPIMRRFCEEVRDCKLHECATAVTVAWSSSWESTAMEMPRDPDMTGTQEQDVRDTVRGMIGAAISVLGNKTPIGGQRSSPWHIPDQRLELPVHYRENLNVWTDAWWQGRERLAESIALARAAMPGRQMVNEWDYAGFLEANKDGKWSALPWDQEFLARMQILADNGICAQVIHMSPAAVREQAAVLAAAGEILRG